MSEAATASGAPVASTAHWSGRVALCLLIAVGTINFIDRQILSVLIEPIRADLHFSDTEFGLLTGLSFAIFYAALGVPVAMMADRVNRVRLVAGACLLWSLFTGACGFATTFWQLAAARFGVGVGEAGGTAPSLSILADFYPPEKRAVITGIFTANGPLGVFLGAALGGWAAARFGWRGAFFGVSLIGMAITPLLLMLVREPVRGAMEKRATVTGDTHVSLARSVRLFFNRRTLALLLAASGLSAFVSYGMLNWIPAFLMRVRHMPLVEVGRWFGPAAGLCMGLGIWGGGSLVNWLGKRDLRAYAFVPGLAMAVAAPSFALALFATSWQASLALMLLPMACVTVYVAPALALVQNLAPAASRATAVALLLLAFNIVGLGGGPLMIGVVSDSFSASQGAEGLRTALLCIAPVSILAAVLYALMSRTVIDDTRQSRLENGL